MLTCRGRRGDQSRRLLCRPMLLRQAGHRPDRTPPKPSPFRLSSAPVRRSCSGRGREKYRVSGRIVKKTKFCVPHEAPNFSESIQGRLWPTATPALQRKTRRTPQRYRWEAHTRLPQGKRNNALQKESKWALSIAPVCNVGSSDTACSRAPARTN